MDGWVADAPRVDSAVISSRVGPAGICWLASVFRVDLRISPDDLRTSHTHEIPGLYSEGAACVFWAPLKRQGVPLGSRKSGCCACPQGATIWRVRWGLGWRGGGGALRGSRADPYAGSAIALPVGLIRKPTADTGGGQPHSAPLVCSNGSLTRRPVPKRSRGGRGAALQRQPGRACSRSTARWPPVQRQ